MFPHNEMSSTHHVSFVHNLRKGLGMGLLLGLVSATAAAEIEIARIGPIEERGLYREAFSILQPLRVEVEAVGSGSREHRALLGQAWILDLRSRLPVWRMDAQLCEPHGDEGNLRQRAVLDLSPGDYELLFSAYGNVFPLEKSIRILEVFKIGDFSFTGGHFVDWDEYGEPDEWMAAVRTQGDQSRGALFRRLPEEPDLGALVRLAPLGDGEVRRARLDLRSPLRARLLVVGEYSASCQGFADAAWISAADDGRRIWEMTFEDSEPAGGAEKNRVFDHEIEISAGSYLVQCVTDDSHAFDRWNSTPPDDPDSWGLTLIPLAPLAPGAAEVVLDPPEENVIVRIDGVGDGEFREAYFRLDHEADLLLRGLGEFDKHTDRYFDFGWIEDPLSLETVWTMESTPGLYAGGECRNRVVEELVRLAPGIYRACYSSDDAHSFESWSEHPPCDPRGWGLLVRGAGDAFESGWVRAAGPEDLALTRISIAPVRDEERRRVRFEVREPLTVRLVALGEGRRGEMYDYGWIENEETGSTVWEMKYADTHGAGGASKNRREDRVLTLEPGRYSLHYVSDGSHAFGDWNETAPDDPHLWGVTLVEVPRR